MITATEILSAFDRIRTRASNRLHPAPGTSAKPTKLRDREEATDADNDAE